MKIFISHSSHDKKRYVDELVFFLRKDMGESVIYDKLSFEAGEKNLDEIYRNLDITNLYVILLSKKALESKWVKKELNFAKRELGKKELERIYPIIVDKNLRYDDEDVPSWLKDYNLKYIENIRKAANLIKERAKNVSWTMHVGMKEYANVFVGRNELLNKFEVRNDDFNKCPINVLIMSGLPEIGRRSLARKCLIKGNIIKEEYNFPSISLSRNESIEDFIIKLNDLGLCKSINVNGLNTKSMDEKINIAVNLTKEIGELPERVLINDDAGIISYKGECIEWFYRIMNNYSLKDKIIYVIITRYKVNYDFVRNSESIFVLHVPELNNDEKKVLLTRLNKLNNINLGKEQMEYIMPYLSGFPEQVFYAIDIIKQNGFTYLKNNVKKVTDYNEQRVSLILEKYKDDEKVSHVLAIVSKYEAISIDMLRDILRVTDGYIEKLDELFEDSIFELEGVTGEYVRLNTVIREYVRRNNFKPLAIHLKKIEEIFSNMFSTNNNFWYNAGDFLLGIRNAVKENKKVDSTYIIPSVYLKGMLDLYDEMRYEEVITLAKRSLENKRNMDEKIVYEINYRMCLAMAKLKNTECIEASGSLNWEDRKFIHAFYYRQSGKNDKSLSCLNELLSKHPDFSEAKREKVIILMRLQQYTEAFILAKENYYLFGDNPYHIQAYFECLIYMQIQNKDIDSEVSKELLELLERLNRIQGDKAKSMYYRCNALYFAFVDKSKELALSAIDKHINDYYKDTIYFLLTKFEIGLDFYDMEVMNSAVIGLQEAHANKNSIVICKSKMMAIRDMDKAKKFFLGNIKYFTEDSKKRFCKSLERINECRIHDDV